MGVETVDQTEAKLKNCISELSAFHIKLLM